MISGSDEARAGHYLMALFKADMVNRLTEEAINAIRPAVRAAADQVVKDLEPNLVTHYDHFANRFIAHLTIKDAG